MWSRPASRAISHRKVGSIVPRICSVCFFPYSVHVQEFRSFRYVVHVIYIVVIILLFFLRRLSRAWFSLLNLLIRPKYSGRLVLCLRHFSFFILIWFSTSVFVNKREEKIYCASRIIVLHFCICQAHMLLCYVFSYVKHTYSCATSSTPTVYIFSHVKHTYCYATSIHMSSTPTVMLHLFTCQAHLMLYYIYSYVKYTHCYATSFHMPSTPNVMLHRFMSSTSTVELRLAHNFCATSFHMLNTKCSVNCVVILKQNIFG